MLNNLGVDVTPHLGAALGNVYTYGAGGLTLRFGEDLPDDYGPPRIRPALPGSDYFRPTDDFGWYFFAGAEGRIVARNIFLDGNTFKDSHSVDKRPLVADLQAGIAVNLRSEEHTSELQSLMRISYAVFCLKKKIQQ